MSSWEKWNENLIWLREWTLTPFGAVWEKAKTWPFVSIIGVLLVLFAIYFFKTPILEFVNHADVGKIVVNSPTVYTRQRLVNDRLDQAHWLRTQLKSTEVGYDQKFNSIDQVRRTVSNTQFKISDAAVDPVDASGQKTADASVQKTTDTAAQKPSVPATDASRGTSTAEAVTVEGTTMSLFRAKNAYREEVRSEITQTELDDRHDIDGNTIFRLTFDASIIAGTRRDAVAAIGVHLRHEPLSKGPLRELYLADYRSLYQDWVEYFQRTLRKSLLSIPRSLLTSEPYPPMRLLFSEFLQRRICQLYLPNVDIDKILNENPPPCQRTGNEVSSEAQKRANELLDAFTKSRAATLQVKRAKDFNRQIESFVTQKYRQSIQDGGLLRDFAISACKASPTGDRIPISNIFIVGPTGLRTGDEIGCPYFDSLKERLLSGVLLYQKLVSATGEQRLEWAKVGAASLSCSEDDCDVKPSTLKCFTADFLKAHLNIFHDPRAQEEQKIDHFLKLSIVGRSLDDCDILVSGRISRYGEKAVDDASLVEFIEYLNRGTDAFAYSVTPKNLTENISTASETRDAFTAMLRPTSQNNEIASLLKQRSDQNLAIVAHPIVVGFGSGFNVSGLMAHELNPEIKAVRSLDFGWIVAPRSLSANAYEQIDGQYPLTAFISVPAWWRTAHVIINSCWLARRALAARLDEPASKICAQSGMTHTNEIIVRLPPAVPEISRKLAFDVVQQPSLYNPTQKELVIGMPGSLLLEGARLWRSTEVTAGAQHADRITVLPNMEGILAEFDCVRPPTGIRTLRQENLEERSDKGQTVTSDFIQVWTSEGVTDRAPVAFVWPAQNTDFLKANALCPDNRPKSVAPSADASSKLSQINPADTVPTTPPVNATPPAAAPPTGASTTPLANAPSNAASTTPPANAPSNAASTTSPANAPPNAASTTSPANAPSNAASTTPPANVPPNAASTTPANLPPNVSSAPPLGTPPPTAPPATPPVKIPEEASSPAK